MTFVTTSNFIFLGNFVDIDTDETDNDAENGNALLGTYPNSDMQNTTITHYDTDEDGAIMDDEFGGSDYVSYDTGSGAVNVQPDTSSWYNAVVTDMDGNTHEVMLVVIQMTNGDTFVADYVGSRDFPLSNTQSIELTSMGDSAYDGYNTNKNVETAPICFAAGTLIETLEGLKAVEELTVGTRVATLDNGFQTIRWIGSMILLQPKTHAPITFAPSSIAKGVPAQSLSVSPQHRIMVSSHIARRITGSEQVLVPAKRLLCLDGVTQDIRKVVCSYWHFIFDEHQIVFANQVPCESLLLGQEAQKTLSDGSLSEIAALVPKLKSSPCQSMPLVRVVPEAKEQKQLIKRHDRNMQSLLQTYPSTRV